MAMANSDERLRAAAIAANRFGLGARPGDLDRIAHDPRGWLLSQIERPVVSATFEGADFPSMMEVREAIASGDAQKRQAMVQDFRKKAVASMGANMTRVASAELSFHERLVWFWLNHFTVTTNRRFIAVIISSYRHDAIEPFVTGRFVDMLQATARHPAMLSYLNNRASVGANSPAGKNFGRGLNENYARELLELHTVGVDGGYSQTDVIELAKILTGWSITPRPDAASRFAFLPRRHEPGLKIVLGKTYGQRPGEAEGTEVLNDLARHSSTARFVARKLAVHFVSENPPRGLLFDLEDAFVRSDGDLREVYRVLIGSPDAWQSERQRLRNPFDYVLAAVRAIGGGRRRSRIPGGMEVGGGRWGRQILRGMNIMGQKPFGAASPRGWPEEAAYWSGPDAVLERVQWAHAIAQIVPSRDVIKLSRQVLGPDISGTTRFVIEGAESPAQGLALLLSSPEFQRR